MTRQITFGALGTMLALGGVDASVLNETPIERVEQIASERVEAKQIENRVETTLPWKGEQGLKVIYDMGEPTLAERMKDKRDREVVTEPVAFGDGGFKVDIILNEKPDTNRFCYTIEGAENYDFFYQPPLTEQEIKEGSERPPEIEGSYAVYHKSLKNNEYKTGKVMHIPRPQVWSLSDENTKVWADLSYNAGELCVTVPQKFIDTATYPVRVDPTFGYTSVGGFLIDWPNDLSWGLGDVSPSSNGTLDSISVYGSRFSTTGVFKGLISLHSDHILLSNGVGGTSSDFPTHPAGDWVVSTFSGVPTLSSSDSYDIALIYEAIGIAESIGMYYDSASSIFWCDRTNSFASPGNPNVADGTCFPEGDYGIIPSIYATYTEGSGGAVPTQDTFWFD